MSKRTSGILLLAAGALVSLFALLADVIGIGLARGFGYFQVVTLVVGLVVAQAGFTLMHNSDSE